MTFWSYLTNFIPLSYWTFWWHLCTYVKASFILPYFWSLNYSGYCHCWLFHGVLFLFLLCKFNCVLTFNRRVVLCKIHEPWIVELPTSIVLCFSLPTFDGFHRLQISFYFNFPVQIHSMSSDVGSNILYSQPRMETPLTFCVPSPWALIGHELNWTHWLLGLCSKFRALYQGCGFNLSPRVYIHFCYTWWPFNFNCCNLLWLWIVS